jgi:DNA-binding CsgD family transcriptional regulator
MQLLQKYLDISQAPDKESFRRRLIAFAHHMDFPLVSAVLMGNHAHALEEFSPYVGNRPADFLNESFDSKNQVADPVLTRLRHRGVPFFYDQKFYVENGAPDLWEHAAPWGFRTGICVSLQLSDDKIFMLGLDRERDLPTDERDLTRMLADLQFLAAHAQDAACRLLVAPRQEQELLKPKLSPKEREILLRVLEGKSNWIIGQLMNVSENTIRFHLKNIFKKLDVSSRVVAATRASSLGLL